MRGRLHKFLLRDLPGLRASAPPLPVMLSSSLGREQLAEVKGPAAVLKVTTAQLQVVVSRKRAQVQAVCLTAQGASRATRCTK